MSALFPNREADLDVWLNNFKTLIVAKPTDYGLVVADGTAISTAYTNWHAAYLAAVNPTTRTKPTIEAKNALKTTVKGVVRSYAATILANLAVSDALKMGLGLHIRDTHPSPVPAPATKPVLRIARTDQGYMDVVATDEATPESRARAAGSVGMLLYRAVAVDAVNDPAQAAFLTFVGKPAAHSTFTAADRGKTATYFARWTNARGEVGPWSNGLSAAIAA